MTDDPEGSDYQEEAVGERSILDRIYGDDGPPDLDALAAPIYWPDLAAADAQAEWNELRGWVEQLIERFPHLDHHAIPACWWRHPSHVEALSALRDHERVSYSESSPGTAAVDWHRAFRDIEARMRDWTAQVRCGAEHVEVLRRLHAADPRDWDRFVARDVTNREQASIKDALREA